MEMTNEKKIEALKEAEKLLRDNGVYLTPETNRDLKDRLCYLAGLSEPVWLKAEATTAKIVDTYLLRNEYRRSVIIFKFLNRDHPDWSTVVMPVGVAKPEEVSSLVDAVRNVVEFNAVVIDDLWDRPKIPAFLADEDQVPF